jgi:Kef-type K+ transport system membrane component KefB
VEHSSLLLTVAVILLGAKVIEALSRRVGLPPVLGEVLYGLVVGPGLLHWIEPDDTVVVLGTLGVVVLLFIAGLETRPAELREVGPAALATAVGGVAVPFVLGFLVGQRFALGQQPSLFLGAILTATSVSISAETLRSLGKLRTRAGTTVMGAAIVDDVLGLLVLALVAASGQGGSLWLPLVRVALFGLVAVGVGYFLVPRLIHAAHSRLSRDATMAMVLAVVLAYSWAAAQLGGLADITGAYLAGLLVGRTQFREQAIEGGLTLGYGLLVPVFLVWVGLQADLGAIVLAPLLTLAVTVAAIVGKLTGCYTGARMQLDHRSAVWVAVAMISRGEVALVVAAVGRRAGLVNEQVFGAAVAMTLFTTLATPLALRALQRVLEGAAGGAGSARALDAPSQLTPTEEAFSRVGGLADAGQAGSGGGAGLAGPD